MDPGSSDRPAVPPAGATRRRSLGGERTRPVAIALLSSIVFFGVLGIVIVNAPGWEAVRISFFDSRVFDQSWPRIAGGIL